MIACRIISSENASSIEYVMKSFMTLRIPSFRYRFLLQNNYSIYKLDDCAKLGRKGRVDKKLNGRRG